MVLRVAQSDVLIAGAGPAGLALATELAGRGLAVTLVERNLGGVWDRSYGAWATALPVASPDHTIIGRFARPRVTFADGESMALGHEYVRFDTSRLQAFLEARAQQAGVRFVHGRCGAVAHDGALQTAEIRDPRGRSERRYARVVVDCTGRGLMTSGEQSLPVAYQSAFGAWFEASGLPIASGEMTLMDLRNAPRAMADAVKAPSFLYAMPEGAGVFFAQETVLASRHPVPLRTLEERLRARLQSLGVSIQHQLRTERCVIPLGIPPPMHSSALLTFGAAGGMVQPASGYCLARSLRVAPAVAAALATGLQAPRVSARQLTRIGLDAVWPNDTRRAWALHRLGLETLLGGREDEPDAFWRAFFTLPGETVPRFLDGGLDSRALAAAMWRIFLRVPARLRLDLLRGGARFLNPSAGESHEPLAS
jgi:lycopene beta-cyclase